MEKRCASCKYVDGIGCSNPTGPCSRAVEGYPKWKPKETAKERPATKTLLDEFAMAAMEGILSNSEYEKLRQITLDEVVSEEKQTEAIASVCYDYAAAMMKERARRDEMGNVKEVDEA